MILGADPGLATCGWAVAVPHTGEILELGTLTSEVDDAIDDSTDRARRAYWQAHALAAVAKKYKCTTLVAEAMSFGGPPKARFAMAISLGLSWGVIVAVAQSQGMGVFETPPKQWQRAVVPSSGKRIDYAKVFKAIAGFIRARGGVAAEQLAAIPDALQNHAVDGAGVAMYAALTPKLTRIAKGARL